ncbi:hypothetical protein CKY47_02305 [Saccharothrix yanglingensis]|uniref:LysR substrate-binding domain-containing protein n=1 Tax=Saccharothrix yanglingensis TaxID=659496 RepID=A0ABU0WSM4_9PSEU|nr:hypothetical protein [Saccharothrix yanglingensis]
MRFGGRSSRGAGRCGRPFVDLNPDRGTRDEVDRAPTTAGVDRRVAVAVDDVHSLLDFAGFGLGVALVPPVVRGLVDAGGLRRGGGRAPRADGRGRRPRRARRRQSCWTWSGRTAGRPSPVSGHPWGATRYVTSARASSEPITFAGGMGLTCRNVATCAPVTSSSRAKATSWNEMPPQNLPCRKSTRPWNAPPENRAGLDSSTSRNSVMP